MDKFVKVLDMHQHIMFGDAAYAMNKVRQEKLRRPQEEPLEEDIQKLRSHIVNKITQLSSDDQTLTNQHKYIELRDCVLSRLILYNARRGGEPSRLFIEEWIDADKSNWLNKKHMEKLDPIDKALASELKIAYQTGKGKHLVPVLFPRDTHTAVRKLADKNLRQQVGIAEENQYLLPSTNESSDHTSGWYSVYSVCIKVELKAPENITSTRNRHRVSTEFAMMDVPVSEREYLFKHLGHSEDTNQHIYQAPLAVRELTVVGRRQQPLIKVSTTGLSTKLPSREHFGH